MQKTRRSPAASRRRRAPGGLMPVMDAERGALNRIRSRAKEFGFKPADVRPFTLKLYSELKANQSSYIFHTNQATQNHPMEVLLEKSDAFWSTRIGLGIHKVLLDGGGNEVPANTPIFHYPDRQWFTGAAVTFATEAQSLEMLYNGLLSLKTDQDVRLENFDTRRLREVPELQYTATTWPVQTGNEMKDLASNFGLWGNKRNQFNLDIANGDYDAIAGVAATSINYAVILVDGFLLVRGAEAITLSDAQQIFRGM